MYQGHKAIGELLIQKGAEVAVQGEYYVKALQTT